MTTAMTTKISVEVEHLVKAPAPEVYNYVADYREHHPKFLPSAFTELTVERGGVGTGTVIRFALKLKGRTYRTRATIDESDPGTQIKEISLDSDMVTTFDVVPHGVAAMVRIHTEWTPADGLQGWLERKFVPRMLHDLYMEELINLDLYAGYHVATRSRRSLAGASVHSLLV